MTATVMPAPPPPNHCLHNDKGEGKSTSGYVYDYPALHVIQLEEWTTYPDEFLPLRTRRSAIWSSDYSSSRNSDDSNEGDSEEPLEEYCSSEEEEEENEQEKAELAMNTQRILNWRKTFTAHPQEGEIPFQDCIPEEDDSPPKTTASDSPITTATASNFSLSSNSSAFTGSCRAEPKRLADAA